MTFVCVCGGGKGWSFFATLTILKVVQLLIAFQPIKDVIDVVAERIPWLPRATCHHTSHGSMLHHAGSSIGNVHGWKSCWSCWNRYLLKYRWLDFYFFVLGQNFDQGMEVENLSHLIAYLHLTQWPHICFSALALPRIYVSQCCH